MDFGLVAGVVIFIAVIFLLSKFVMKTVFKTILLAISILFLASILLALFLIYDGYKTADMLAQVPILLLSDQGNITSGLMLAEEAIPLTMEELWHYSGIVTNGEQLNGTFILIANSSVFNDGISDLLSLYKSGKVEIYPETFTLTVIRYLPDSIIRSIRVSE